MTEAPLYYQSATELGALIRKKQISSVELTQIFLERAKNEGRQLNAISEVTEELALQQAKRADEELVSGAVCGPLHGVPYGAKDLLAVSGYPVRWGSPAHSEQVPDSDAAVIARLRSAGAVLICKLAMIELAGGGSYSSAGASATGPCLNPWNTSRWAGGSSSGSGAAAAAGITGFALGTETWGSITVPAAFCGITGLRPTFGRVSRTGAMALCWSLDKIGPMARTAEDCGHILAAIAGPDPRDAGCAARPFRFQPKKKCAPLRLGILEHDYTHAPQAQTLFQNALQALQQAGHTARPVKLPDDLPVNQAASLIVMAEGSTAFENLIRSERLGLLADRDQQAGLLAGLAITASDLMRAQRIRTIVVQELNKIWDQCDLLIAPTLLTGALSAEIPFREQNNPWGGNGGPGNLAGWPSLSLPMGFDAEGLPMGLELIGPAWSEHLLLSLGMQYQQRTSWHRMFPANTFTRS